MTSAFVDVDGMQRLNQAISQGGGVAVMPQDWVEIDALAQELNNDLELYPVIHAWPTKDGAQLTFWCAYCKDHHVHGRHIGFENLVARFGTHPLGPGLTARRFACTFNDRVPGGRGFCTCPIASGDGHRVAHCYHMDSPYWQHGYIIHEVPAGDARALRKVSRPRRKRSRN